MFKIPRKFLRLAACSSAPCRCPTRGCGDQEISANSSERLLRWDATGVPYLGAARGGTRRRSTTVRGQPRRARFGFGAVTGTTAAIATNLQVTMLYLTPTSYFRNTFTVTAADQPGRSRCSLRSNITMGSWRILRRGSARRRNAGPAKKFIYHDQPAYNRRASVARRRFRPRPFRRRSTLASLPRAPNGSNVLAIHLLNASANDTTFYLKPTLRIFGAPSSPYDCPARPGSICPASSSHRGTCTTRRSSARLGRMCFGVGSPMTMQRGGAGRARTGWFRRNHRDERCSRRCSM